MNTETNVPKMPETLQEYFNIAWQKFVVEKALRSASEGGMCYYRYPGDPSRRCAIGHAIPDELYKPSQQLSRAVFRDAEWKYLDGLRDLQAQHDECADLQTHEAFTAAITRRLTGFALRFNLTIPEVSA